MEVTGGEQATTHGLFRTKSYGDRLTIHAVLNTLAQRFVGDCSVFESHVEGMRKTQNIPMRIVQRRITKRQGNALERNFRRSDRQQDRKKVIHTWIRINNQGYLGHGR